MDTTGWRRICGLLLVAGLIGVDGDSRQVDGTRSTAETLRRVGRRLSRVYSERQLTAIATRGADLLTRLDADERRALGSGYLRFRVDRPVVVDVAAPADSVPFWLADRGFRETGVAMETAGTRWRIFRREFNRGAIGLGVNGLDRTPAAHYVVFVRSQRRDGRNRSPVVALEVGQSESWRIVPAGPGLGAAWDAHTPFDRLPEELDGAIVLQPSRAARHSTMLAKGRVWKTHVVSGHAPDQVAISYGDDPIRELVWTWRTSEDVSGTAIRIAEGDRGDVRVVEGDSSLVAVPEVLNDPVIRRHRASVSGLEPGRSYRYALGDGSPRGWGPWRTVRTAPPPGQALRFLYFGDAQTGLEGWGRLVQAAVRRHPGMDFVVLAGDLVDRGNERTNWDHLFLRAAPMLDAMPVMPCVGNHEYLDVGPRLYRAFFELPRNGPPGIDSDLVYSFEAGDACFAVMDSTLAVWDPESARRQAEWLAGVLSRTAARWKIAIFHHPVYPAHPWRDMPALREHWVPVFDRHHVDLVLQGHDHSYQRTYPLRAHRRVASPEDGTIYAIAVSGDKYVEQGHRDVVEVALAHTSTYQTIEIDPRSDRLDYRAWTEDGRVVDAFAIEKKGRGSFAVATAAARAVSDGSPSSRPAPRPR